MRRAIPFSILAGLVIIAAHPLWGIANYLASYDGLLHLYRVFALDQTLRQGVVYPRWLLDLAYGYGYPIFNFYPPLAAYLAETIHILGLGFIDALKATFVAIIAVAVLGAYVMGQELFSREEDAEAIGILTAAAYVFFPYFMVDVYTRGAMAEALAAALLPWLIWGLRRTLVQQTVGAFLLTLVLVAALILAHSLTALIVTPLLIAYALFELRRLPVRVTALARGVAATGLGLGLCAFYWLPFVAELPLVQMGRGVDVISEIFETNFLKLPGLIQPSLLYHYGGPPVPLGLAVVIIAVLALGLALVAGSRLKERATILFFGAAALVGVIAITEPMRGVWLALSFSTMIQSVWRVSIVICLGVSIVIGSLPATLSAVGVIQRWEARLPRPASNPGWVCLSIVVAVALVLISTTLADLAPQQVFLPPGRPTVARLARFEVFTTSLGTTTFGEYLPATVEAADLTNYRAPTAQPSASASPAIRLLRRTATQYALAVSTRDPVPLSLRAFYFPDWQATVDGISARVYSTTPMGLLTVDVPTGDHLVVLSLEDTPARRIGTLVSGATALVVLALTAFALRRREAELWIPLLMGGILLVVMAVPAAMALAASPSVIRPAQTSLSPGLDLIGLGVDGAETGTDAWRIPNPSESLHLRAYWQVKQSDLKDAPIRWRLVDAQGRVWAQRAQLPRYGTALESTWVANEVVEDRYDLPLAAETPRGVYTLQVAYGLDQGYVTSGLIELASASPPAPDRPRVAHPLNATFGDQIRLLGYGAAPTAQPGEAYPLTLYWQAQRDLFEDLVVSAQLLNADGQLVAQHDSPPADGLNPTSLWIPNEPVIERRDLDLPPELKPGAYTLIAVVYHSQDLKRLAAVTEAGPSPHDAVVLGRVEVR